MITRCSKCKHGKHKQHEGQFIKDGKVYLCYCRVCVPIRQALKK